MQGSSVVRGELLSSRMVHSPFLVALIVSGNTTMGFDLILLPGHTLHDSPTTNFVVLFDNSFKSLLVRVGLLTKCNSTLHSLLTTWWLSALMTIPRKSPKCHDSEASYNPVN